MIVDRGEGNGDGYEKFRGDCGGWGDDGGRSTACELCILCGGLGGSLWISKPPTSKNDIPPRGVVGTSGWNSFNGSTTDFSRSVSEDPRGLKDQSLAPGGAGVRFFACSEVGRATGAGLATSY